MDLLANISGEQREVGVRALLAVARVDGTLEDHERGLLEAVAQFAGLTLDLGAATPADPKEVARVFPDEQGRLRVVQAQMIMAMMDGEVSRDEMKLLKTFCAELGVSDPRLKNLEQHMKGHILGIKLDMNRRSQMITEVFQETWARGGLKGLWRSFGGMRGLAQDPAVAWRYKQLGLLPEGTFGRAYWAHMTRRSFSLPGELKAFPETLVKHDLCHVLGGYDTDAVGECEVIAFIAGFMKADPFWYIFAIAMHMHLGVEIFDGDNTARFAFDPARVLRALERGAQVTEDLYDTKWDYWPLFSLPLDEVRARYNILPL